MPAKAEDARASRRPVGGTGSPAEGDSRGWLRCAFGEGAGAVERGGLAASPGCAVMGAGATGAPARGWGAPGTRSSGTEGAARAAAGTDAGFGVSVPGFGA